MSAKKYVLYLVSALFLFMILNIFLWHFHVKKFFDKGDLNRLANFYTTEAQLKHKKYSVQHTEIKDYINSGVKESFDIITIGDSFSNGDSGEFFQDYLSERYGFKVLNFRLNNPGLTNLYILISSGLLDEIGAKIIILENVGRTIQNRLGKAEIPQNSISRSEAEHLIKIMKINKLITSGLVPPVMFQANMKFLQDIFYRKLYPEKLSPEVYMAELDRKFFTNKGQENLLLFYKDDFNYLNYTLNPEMINKNLNNAAGLLEKKNVKLFFMPCVDKYDLYYSYIKEKRGRPENTLFEKLRNLHDKKYIFIDTKKILRKALEDGEKDLYWLNDTHWSRRGFEIVFNECRSLLIE